MIIIDPVPVLPFPLWLIINAIAAKKMKEKEAKKTITRLATRKKAEVKRLLPHPNNGKAKWK